jgi:hypothetical protein
VDPGQTAGSCGATVPCRGFRGGSGRLPEWRSYPCSWVSSAISYLHLTRWVYVPAGGPLIRLGIGETEVVFQCATQYNLKNVCLPCWQVTSADSIAGGDPAWDATLGPPPETMRSCGSCGDPLVQLLQIPTDTNTLQRTVYLLVCNKNRSCAPSYFSNLTLLIVSDCMHCQPVGVPFSCDRVCAHQTRPVGVRVRTGACGPCDFRGHGQG